jgi:hypothetical protein
VWDVINANQFLPGNLKGRVLMGDFGVNGKM